MKTYEVSIKSKQNHGRWGKREYFSYVVDATSKKAAAEHVQDILEGLSLNELAYDFCNERDFEYVRFVASGYMANEANCAIYALPQSAYDKPIGELAGRLFSVVTIGIL